jgi:acyl-phosphate glycerol 3-phosphate acyltransferase
MRLPDPRSYGSNNPGATNVLRTGRKTAAALTLVGDAAKGLVAVLRVRHYVPDAAPYAALAVFLGHLFPAYHGLQGGKGVATAAGVLFAIDWRIGLGTLATWFIIAAFLRYSSLAALVAAAFAPFFTALVLGVDAYFACVLVMGALLGSDVRLAGPAELHPPKDVTDLARDIAGRTGARITITDDPALAVADADFIHTDVWVSMGESKDVWTERVRVLTPYQVNADLMRKAGNPAVKFMHCLPAFHDPNTVVGREIMEHTGMTNGLEVTGEVFSSPASIVFDQAENRLHTIKAILVATLGR